MRTCTRCGVDQDEGSYYAAPKNRDGLSKVCRTCTLTERKELRKIREDGTSTRHQQQQARMAARVEGKMRTCFSCGSEKNVADFYRSKSRDGYEGICIECKSIKAADQNKKLKDGIPSEREQLGDLLDILAQHGKGRCSTCHAVLDLSFFPKNASRKYGYSNVCRSCTDTYMSAYMRENKEHIVSRKRERAQTPEGKEANARAVRRYREKNKHATNQHTSLRYARKALSNHEVYTREDIYTRDKGTCQICGTFLPPSSWHLDHYVPLSKGGSDTPDNVRVTCTTCNSKKNDSYPDGTWVPS